MDAFAIAFSAIDHVMHIIHNNDYIYIYIYIIESVGRA